MPKADRALQTDKKRLREKARGVRTEAAADAPNAGESIARHLLARPPLLLRGAIAGYWPIRDEVDPRPLMQALRTAGASLALPVVTDADAPLEFRFFGAEAELEVGVFGVRHPPLSAAAVRPSILLVPMLAFDRTGRRLGYGGGYYDRTLAALRGAVETTAIGLAFAAQEVDALPAGPLDQPLDWIATEKGVIKAGG
ncbi:MAG: 5-formyltetrahydrofolate cyclo-ligase [Pseudomonadota bacterium]